MKLLRLQDERDAEDIRYPGLGRVFLIWNVIGILTSARWLLGIGLPGYGRDPLLVTLACVAMYYPWILLSPLVFRMERSFPLGVSGWPKHLAWLIAISVPLCLLASPMMVAGFIAPLQLAGSRPWPVRGGFWFSHFSVSEICFWSSVAGGYVIRTVFQLHQQERRASRLALEKSQLEASLNQAQLEALRARLNPHFLFNSLQNISVLTKQDPQTASRMLTVLGDLLRAVLRSDSQPEISLSEEIDLTRSYVALEQMRFGDRLRVTFDIAGGVQQAMVPSFLMQPLLENAIIHGLRGVRKTGIIAVRAAEEEQGLAITVTDNGNGPPTEASEMKIGVGLGSTCERLARMYSDRHGFSIRRLEEGGTEVRITLPLRFVNAAGDAHTHEEIPATDR
jgi:two-component sensor histidine kinase